MYAVVFSDLAEAFLLSADKPLRKQLGYDIHLLQLDPRREGTKQLKGKINKKIAYRLRSGNYRIVYHIDHKFVVIDVLKIGPRGGVYK